jgi:hypothetical protein
MQHECKWVYRDLEWKEGRFVFSDVFIFDYRSEKSSFHGYAENVSLSLDWSSFPKKLKGHLLIQRPSLTFLSHRHWKESKGGWFDLTLSIEEGLVEWAGIERARFSYTKYAPDHLGRLNLAWGNSSLDLEAFQEGSALKCDGAFKNLNVFLLRRLVEFYAPGQWERFHIQEGGFDGQAHLVFEEGQAKSGLAHLDLRRMAFGWGDWKIKGLDGSLDWDGAFEQGKPLGLFENFTSFSCGGQLHGSFQHAGILMPDGAIEDLGGYFSYNPGMGANWDINGIGSAQEKSFPFKWQGKGYFHSQVANWIESSAILGDTALVLNGNEEGDRRIWQGSCHNLSPEQGAFLQAVGSKYIPSAWSFSQGVFNVEGRVCFLKEQIESWALSHLKAEKISLDHEEIHLACQRAEGNLSSEGGAISLEGGSFQIPLQEGNCLSGQGWKGVGIWLPDQMAPSQFVGFVENVQTELCLSGTLKEWQAKALLSTQEIEGTLALLGGWNGEQFDAKIEKGTLEGVTFSGSASLARSSAFSIYIDQFHGQIDSLSKIWKGRSIAGEISSRGPGFLLEGSREGWDWSLEAGLTNGSYSTQSNWKLSDISTEIVADSERFYCYRVEGNCALPQGNIHWASPLLGKKKEEWTFDVRVQNKAWDVLRLVGQSDGREIVLDPKSHLLGAPLFCAHCSLDEDRKLDQLDIQLRPLWKSFLTASSFLQSFGVHIDSRTPLAGALDIQLHYNRKGGSEIRAEGVDLHWEGLPIPLDFYGVETGEQWTVERFKLADIAFTGLLRPEGEAIRILKGKGTWEKGVEADFEGSFFSDLRCELQLSKVQVYLEQAQLLTQFLGKELKGTLRGDGHFIYDRGIETDFDFIATGVKVDSFPIENKGPVNFYFSSTKGMIFRGIDLQVSKPDTEFPWIDCKVDVLQYDTPRTSWLLTHSHVHLPADCLTFFKSPSPFFQSLKLENDLDFIADLECTSDFSLLTATLKDGFLPLGGTVHHVKDMYLQWAGNRCATSFSYFYQGHLLKVGLDVSLDSKLEGRLTLEDHEVLLNVDERPLAIDWEYGAQGIFVHAIEGSFGGANASFHAERAAEGNTLIGSARMDFGATSELVPPRIAELFQELKMGKGYEMKGRLTVQPTGQVFFKGLMSGKQLELFGFQFRTMLAHIEVGPESLHLYDLKISDTAGMMKIDQIFVESVGNEPWTVEIPRVTILELRPSLLQKVGRQPGQISPLVIRELTMTDFKGLLDDSVTYTAEGHLHFINSYKREHTVLDIPADVLSRIVGLDLELLIPAVGSLSFDLHDGLFHLLELKHAFSEGKRSEFFLALDEQEPVMDLDGNIKILVKMKQFVLFKFTEAFLISIEGNLTDPKFHLQKKKRFLGI